MENQKIIDKTKLLENISACKGKKICAMVKSNAYGHGLEEIVSAVHEKIDYFGVVNLEEARRVQNISSKPILVCSRLSTFKNLPKNVEVMIESDDDLNRAINCGIADKIHLKIDVGMHRFGANNIECLQKINQILDKNDIKLKSIYSHFSRSDNKKFTEKQYQRFLQLRSEIYQNCPICFGGSNLINYDFDYDMLRLGIGMYGYENPFFSPVMQIKSYVEKIFDVDRGDFVGYGTKGKVFSKKRVAIIPIGYGDGLCRGLSGRFFVEIGGRKFKAIGNICMDCFFVVVDQNVNLFDEVVVMADANYFAKKQKTISYEILTNFSSLRGKTVVK